jgi:peptidoglycan/xylan/chitin deacetylase (PgdA/CDA1 family)
MHSQPICDIPLNKFKKLFAACLSRFKIDSNLILFLQKLYSNKFIRAVNYHYTPSHNNTNFAQQLELFRNYFSDVNLTDLDNFFYNHQWTKPKPGLIISFDDGFRSNYLVAAPLLEKYGFTGWFFVCTDFISCPANKQEDFAKAHHINYCSQEAIYKPLAMSWEDIIDLDKRGHVIGSHTKTHYRMEKNAPLRRIEEEITNSKNILEEKLNHEINIFAWVGGEVGNYNPNAANRIKKAGYKYSFMTNSAIICPNTNKLQLRRTQVESWWPLDIITFQLSGLLDIYYIPKVKFISQLTKV